MIISDKQKSLIQSVLDLANMKEEIRSIDQVERLFQDHRGSPLWLTIKKKNDVTGFISLRDKLRERFESIVAENSKMTEEKTDATPKYNVAQIKRDIVREFQTDCVETGHILANDLKGKLIDFQFPTWGIPTLSFDRHGNLRFDASPLLTGVHSVYLFGLILLFVSGLSRNLTRCKRCQNFYLKTKGLRVACSNECKRVLRYKDIASYVKKWRDDPKRKRQKQKPKKTKKRALAQKKTNASQR